MSHSHTRTSRQSNNAYQSKSATQAGSLIPVKTLPKYLVQYTLLSLACWAMVWYMRSSSVLQGSVMISPSFEDIKIVKTVQGEVANITVSYSDADFNETKNVQTTHAPLRYESSLVTYADNLVSSNSVEEHAITAILPVTQSSLPDMLSTLSLLLPNPGRITEMVLLCPENIQTTVRHALRHLLYSSEYPVYVDIDLSVWPSDVDEDMAVLHVAQQLSAHAFLLLNSAGFTELKPVNIASLMSSPILALPIGPRASDLSGADFVCFPSQSDEIAGFLSPPFIIPSAILPRSITADPKLGIWASFGKHVTSSLGTGGIVYGLVEAGGYSCSSEHRHQSLFTSSVVYAATEYQGEDTSAHSISSNHFPITDNPGTFIFVFPEIQDLRFLYPVICRLQEEGHHAFSLITAEKHASFTPIDPQAETLSHLEDCDIDITVLPDSDTLDDSAVSLWDWIVALPSPPDVVVTPDQAHLSLEALGIMRRRHPDFDAPVLRIPLLDLPFCDWMGSLSLEEWLNWHIPQVDITIITDSRPASLARLLNSLSSAHVFGDKIDVRINLEQTADPETKRVIQDFRWKHGSVSVNRRVIHGGLLPAVVESWYPRSNDSYGLILEDDVEVSPLFYAWVKMSLLRYRYGRADDKSLQLFGISLYQQKNLELRPEGSRHRFSPRTTFSSISHGHVNSPYLSQIPCSWGAVYFPEQWREFHDYLSMRLSGGLNNLAIDSIVAPGVRSNKWTRSWKKYFIEMAYLRGYVMLYPNYQDYVSLSTNHLEVGSHVRDMPQEVYAQKRKLFLHPLMQLPTVSSGVPAVTGLLDLPDHEMPAWKTLPVLDLLGLMSDQQTLLERGRDRGQELFGCRADVDGRFDVQDWLCLSDSEAA